MANKLQTILDSYVTNNQLEDRSEYDVVMLQTENNLTLQEATDLHYLVQREFHQPGTIATADAFLVHEFIVEAEHGNLDGWDSEHDRIVIQRFLDECAAYANAPSI